MSQRKKGKPGTWETQGRINLLPLIAPCPAKKRSVGEGVKSLSHSGDEGEELEEFTLEIFSQQLEAGTCVQRGFHSFLIRHIP